MTRHARLSGRDAVVLHMMLVTERDRLHRRILHRCVPGSSVDDVSNRDCGGCQKNGSEDGDLGDRIRARSKNLCHIEPGNSLSHAKYQGRLYIGQVQMSCVLTRTFLVLM